MRRRPSFSSTSLRCAGLTVVLSLAACGGQPAATQLISQVQRVVVDPADAAALPDLVAAADALGLGLIRAAGDVTTVTSPSSLQVALSMAAEGADGESLSQLEAVIGATGEQRSEGMNALTGTLAELDGDPDVAREKELPDIPVVHRASRLVLDDSLPVRQSFVDALARSYDATAHTTDLGGRDARKALDAWVAEHTGGLVPRSAIEPGPELRLVLQDAIVLAARWEQPFLAEATRPQPFTLPSGEEVQVDMMSGFAEEAPYTEVQGWQAVRLRYTGGRVAADVILPPPGTSPTALEPDVLGEIMFGLEEHPGRPLLLQMPVVDARSTVDLMAFLGELAPSSLQGGFGGITEAEELFISQAAQQGVLVIDEDGTLAAAVTEMAAAGSGPPESPLELVVNRPYLVRIADGKTRWTLFLSHIADPRAEE